jgi:metal-sulfur cluster biosynthetic enzyme
MTSGDPEILEALQNVHDPELGIGIVDLGLVYRAERTAERIDVAVTLTTPSCPLGEMIVEEVRYALEQRFPDGPPVHVELVWEPAWSPERMSETARQLIA